MVCESVYFLLKIIVGYPKEEMIISSPYCFCFSIHRFIFTEIYKVKNDLLPFRNTEKVNPLILFMKFYAMNGRVYYCLVL